MKHCSTFAVPKEKRNSMLSDKMVQALNEQISMEGAAMQKYLAMALWCDSAGLEGAAGFYYDQSDEERMHMMKIVHYVQDQDRVATVPALASPKHSYEDIYEVVQAGYDSEKAVTASIHLLVELAESENDRQTFNFLQWYVTEQLEEEVMCRRIIDRMKLIGTGGRYLYYIDKAFTVIRAEAEAADNEA
ncbi:ferritin [Chitinophagales bacterium]|nr:ferritin [Chitinophagales bacterium]